MKSLCVSVFWPVWEWITRPSTRWLFASYAEKLSIRDSIKCRRIIESAWYRARWGDAFRLVGDQNAKDRFENDKTGYRIATSVGGTATGEGGDILVADDPNKLEEIHSEAARLSVNRWLDEIWPMRRNDPTTSRMVIVQQRGHERDATGHLLAKDAGWELLKIPMEYKGKKLVTSLGGYDPREKEGDLMWPERVNPETLIEMKKDLGRFGVAGQLQQEPEPEGGRIFMREHWKYYKALPAKFDGIALSWDATFKGLSDSDFVAGQAWGWVGAMLYLIDRVKDRLSFTATLQAIINMRAKWPTAQAVLVEDKANGPAVIDVLKKKIPGMIAVEPEGGKLSRAYAAQPQQEAGNIWIPDPSIAPWVGDFVGECAAFPGAPNDDEVDAMTQFVNWHGRRAMPGFFMAG